MKRLFGTSARFALGAALVFSSACGRVPLDLPAPDTAGTGGGGALGSSGVSAVKDMSGPACGKQRCAAKQLCCVLNGSCIDLADAATACPKPTTTPVNSVPGTRTCGSNADCATSEFCETTSACLGPGTCVDRSNCGTSGGATFCGCDGVTYPSVQAACRAGIKTQGPGACGAVSTPGDAAHDAMIFCGTDAQCPSGLTCCAFYGRCLDPKLPDLCTPPPTGARQSCLTDRQCFAESEFCEGPGCSGPGGCVIAGGQCTGVLEPVCGCDGKTYTNQDCTHSTPTRTSHEGACTTP